ncbi:hypothetical protein WDW89_07285 [Deltaproteobacteria bacterium TL4]
MSVDSCYLCKNPIPVQQSFYEAHGVRVCLECFTNTPRCQKCKFPSTALKRYPGFGNICEFCQKSLERETGMECYLCQKKIPSWGSCYSDYGKHVCQDCFKNAERCFLCRFPKGIEKVDGLGYLCEFCQNEVLKKGMDLDSFLGPLKAFLAGYQHPVPSKLNLHWIDWHVLVGMQWPKERPPYKIKYLDEFLYHCYPIYYSANQFYLIPRIPHQQFMVYMAGQLAASDLCQRFQQNNLLGDNPFFKLARAWSHFIAYNTATLLHYEKLSKHLQRWPEAITEGDFQKFVAMQASRKPGQIVEYAHSTLKQYAQKYLNL